MRVAASRTGVNACSLYRRRHRRTAQVGFVEHNAAGDLSEAALHIEEEELYHAEFHGGVIRIDHPNRLSPVADSFCLHERPPDFRNRRGPNIQLSANA